MDHTSVVVKSDSVEIKMKNALTLTNADMELISAIDMQFVQILLGHMNAIDLLDSMVMVSIVVMMTNVLMAIITVLLEMKVVTVPVDFENTNVNAV